MSKKYIFFLIYILILLHQKYNGKFHFINKNIYLKKKIFKKRYKHFNIKKGIEKFTNCFKLNYIKKINELNIYNIHYIKNVKFLKTQLNNIIKLFEKSNIEILDMYKNISNELNNNNLNVNKLNILNENELNNNLNVNKLNNLNINELNNLNDNKNIENKEKLIIIIGVTCSGKTKFSIDLSKELLRKNINCEIINSDSMQVYKNFNIGTAKIKENEKQDIKHHLLDICYNTENFNVHKFINYTIPLIHNLNKEKKISLITGGTLLYIESLLWSSIVDLKEEEIINKNNINSLKDKINLSEFEKKYEHLSNDEIYNELKKVDEERSKQLHKNERKRICRSLYIYYIYNIKHSELIKINNHKNNRLNNMRFIPCIFYLDYNDDQILKKEIEKRVNKMISDGLLEEAINLKKINENQIINKNQYNLNEIQNLKNNRKKIYKGINQSIAYKEFDDYIEMKMKNIDDHDLFNKCKDNLIRKTYKYAKRQRRWVYNRFIKTYKIPIHKINVCNNYTEQLNDSLNIILNFLKN